MQKKKVKKVLKKCWEILISSEIQDSFTNNPTHKNNRTINEPILVFRHQFCAQKHVIINLDSLL